MKDTRMALEVVIWGQARIQPHLYVLFFAIWEIGYEFSTGVDFL